MITKNLKEKQTFVVVLLGLFLIVPLQSNNAVLRGSVASQKSVVNSPKRVVNASVKDKGVDSSSNASDLPVKSVEQTSEKPCVASKKVVKTAEQRVRRMAEQETVWKYDSSVVDEIIGSLKSSSPILGIAKQKANEHLAELVEFVNQALTKVRQSNDSRNNAMLTGVFKEAEEILSGTEKIAKSIFCAPGAAVRMSGQTQLVMDLRKSFVDVLSKKGDSGLLGLVIREVKKKDGKHMTEAEIDALINDTFLKHEDKKWRILWSQIEACDKVFGKVVSTKKRSKSKASDDTRSVKSLKSDK